MQFYVGYHIRDIYVHSENQVLCWVMIVDIHGTKITKNQIPLAHVALLYYSKTVCKKSDWSGC